MNTKAAELPLALLFPGVASLPRAGICDLPTPVSQVPLPDGRSMLVKRDDLSASPLGGNKARGLDWLLGSLSPGDEVVTVGPTGSNHALATATYARRMGARAVVARWRQHANSAAELVDRRLRREARVIDAGVVPAAYAVATYYRLRGARWIPAGGTAPLAILGHVNAALELAGQIDRGECAAPSRIFVPLGTGGTAAGLRLGFQLAGVDIPMTAVRVVPRIIGRARRLSSLANRAAALLQRVAGRSVPHLSPGHFEIEHRFFGGGYGRPLASRAAVLAALASAPFVVDDTYSLKACAAALHSREPLPLLWLTFDGRALQNHVADQLPLSAP